MSFPILSGRITITHSNCYKIIFITFFYKQKQVVKEGQVICYIEQLGGEIPVEVLYLLFGYFFWYEYDAFFVSLI